MNIQFRATEDELTLFWDRPVGATGNTTYLVYINQELKLKTEKNHAYIKYLDADTGYGVRIEVMDDSETFGTIFARTLPVKRRVNVCEAPYKAVGDGRTLNTKAIQRAIDACGPGDILFFPEGKFLTGALKMHSDMDIYVSRDAVIQGSENPADYLPKIHSRFEGYEMECYQSLFNFGTLNHEAGFNCENIIIRGEGSIMGGGKELAKAIARDETERLKDYIASLGEKIKEYEKPETLASRARGRLINLSNCNNVWIHGLTLGFGPAWNIHFIYSSNVYTDACTIRSEGVWNGDGWDPDSSTDSSIFNCDFYTEDDSVAIKSGKNPEGNIINRPTKNIKVFDCITHFGHGICMGSEMSGGIDGVKIWNCELGPTWSGVEIKATKKRGGYVRNIEVSDCLASHLQMHSVGYNDDGVGAEFPPILENCRFERLHLLNRYLDNNNGKNEWHACVSIDLQGFDEPGYEIKNIYLKDIEIENASIDYRGSILMKYCKNITIENISSVEPDPDRIFP